MSVSVPVSPQLTHKSLRTHTRQHTNSHPTTTAALSLKSIITPRNILNNVLHPIKFVGDVALGVSNISATVANKLNNTIDKSCHIDVCSNHTSEYTDQSIHNNNNDIYEKYIRKQLNQSLIHYDNNKDQSSADSTPNITHYNNIHGKQLLREYKQLLRTRQQKYKYYIQQLQSELHIQQQLYSHDINNMQYNTMYNNLVKQIQMDKQQLCHNDQLIHQPNDDTVQNNNVADSPRISDTHANFSSLPILDNQESQQHHNDSNKLDNILHKSSTDDHNCGIDTINVDINSGDNIDADDANSRLLQLCDGLDVQLLVTDDTMISNNALNNLITLFNIQLNHAITNNNNQSDHNKPRYELSSSCYTCSNEFTFFTRRHHCRLCLLSVCSTCSTHTVLINHMNQRVCDQCYVMQQYMVGNARNCKKTSHTLLIHNQNISKQLA